MITRTYYVLKIKKSPKFLFSHILNLLVQNYTNINAKDMNCKTVLHHTLESNEAIAISLLELGTATHYKTLQGESVKDFAIKYNKLTALQYIELKEADKLNQDLKLKQILTLDMLQS